jgi:hypothetical protein
VAESVDYYLSYLGDEYKPNVPKPELQQYSPYQTDDIYCTDITYLTTYSVGGTRTDIFKNQTQLAVQAYGITLIPCNFNQIAQNYP